MTSITASLNAKVDPDDKAAFVATATDLGLTPSEAIRVFVRAFNEWGGFPFAVRRSFPISAEERESITELDRQIASGEVRRYAAFGDLVTEVAGEAEVV
jgi:DNA-damage-inducible protein J